MIYRKIIFSILVISCLSAISQNRRLRPNKSSLKGTASYALGLGLPYGGLGGRLGYNVANYFNVFGGVGYQYAGVGYNIGIRKDFLPLGISQYYVSAMFGTNAHIKGSSSMIDDGLFLGPTIGAGIKLNSKIYRACFLDFGILFPFKSSKFKDKLETMKRNKLSNYFDVGWPVILVVGLNFGF